MSNTKKRQDNPLHSLIAGGVAGAVEATITYPTEYVKTQLQLQEANKGAPAKYKGPIDCLRTTVRTQGISAVYRGLSALVIGTAAKAGVRFLTFDAIANPLRDEKGRLTGTRSLIAGIGAGITESVLVVTPTETIKTKLIHDQNQPHPKYKGLVHGVTTIVREEGPGGVYRGLFPVMLRQSANSAVRFTVYSLLKQRVQIWLHLEPGKTPPAWATFGIGATAGVICVYTTMPLDCVKTKMQGLRAKELYKNSLDCFLKTLRNEGVLSFWKGATPRLTRLMFSGGIIFTVYEEVMKVLQVISPAKNELNKL
ncbi:uncharacterized protein VTP21DRAFT_552 [Calcarisporiella thermophila]|uniref:uncharacterized protein n=1 Tax=Calcarisporiella thermophila TaxID=911321 RepID=UPI003742FDA7